MKVKKLVYRIKPPCRRCPYRLGIMKTVVNPCPQCRLDGYQSYGRFRKQAHKRQAGKRWAVSSPISSIYSKGRIKEMEVIMLSKKILLDLVLLALTAGIIVAKAAYGTDWPSRLEGWTE